MGNLTSDSNTISPPNPSQLSFLKWILLLPYRILKEINLLTLNPLRSILIVTQSDIPLLFCKLLDRFNIRYFIEDLDDVDALMVWFDDEEAIIIDKDSSLTKKRELIAHELGYFLFHTGNGILYKKKKPLWVSQDEVKTQRFALYLLIPDERDSISNMI